MADDVLPKVDQATSTRVGQGTDPSRTQLPDVGGEPAGLGDVSAIPEQIGRYRVVRLLGEGAFGRVFLARDDELQRDVAIKVPQPGRVARPEDLAQYLAEARTLAKLEHPGIVPVFDVGRTPDGLCYVVSRYVEGANLAARLKGPRLSLGDSLSLAADVAEALGHAHAKGLVHRDVKPANILLDTTGKPILADFGLALREEDFGTGETLTGTPAYMSPEQARGEGHRVDARSDLFSLGVVLFEMLTGRLPFQGSTISALIDKIATADAPSPRQFEPALPAEAERICLKALARRASDRYATAHDLVDDLRHLLAAQTRGTLPEATASTSQPIVLREPAPVPVAQPRVVPKGLRSFDAGDADFFLDLLPGPRDRDGLPESLRFWKSRIEQPDPAQSFSVGLIYGPSGCGKSSLMKAGLLPRLSPEVRTVYVEATSDDTEARLCRGLRNLRLPVGAARETLRGVAPDEAGSELVRTLTELRRGAGTTASPRVYLSSSYVDLVAHRAGVLQALHTAGLDCSAMEHYGAADERPAEFCLADVRRCDLYVGIFAHRYGYVPAGAAASITELEYREARKLGRPTLIFLVAPKAAWPETLRETGPGAERLVKLRQELETDRIVAYFETPEDLALKVTAAVARWLQGRGQTGATAAGGKTLLVIDQFEQWLYAHRDLETEPLVAALRQCDGTHLQAVVMIRDDFYMPVSRFFQRLDIQLQEGRNLTAIDLFDVSHARKLLTAFGRAYGQLPEGEPTAEQQAFLDQAVEGLAEESKVISVRLALFSEMVKAKPWTVATLSEIGGVSGVGVTFLEETFSAKSAPVASRRHELAARGVLQVLLPEGGTGIKGHRQSEADLLAASGYDRRPADFADLLRLLNTELRLITPIDEADAGESVPDSATAQTGVARRFYQLTHDYLVPSLRDWLTRKQKETRQGRAELLLADRTAVWNARPENRQLPSLWQWCQIRWLTVKKNWTPTQRKMMGRARRYHGLRGTMAVLLVVAATFVGLTVRQQVREQREATEAAGLVKSLLTAETAQVPAVINAMSGYRRWIDSRLHEENNRSTTTPRQKLHVSLALLPADASQTKHLYERLLNAEPQEISVIRDALEPHKAAYLDKLWAVVEAPEKGKESQRLRAAAALAQYDPDSKKWETAQAAVGDDLVKVPAVFLSIWMDALRPVRAKLFPQLAKIFGAAEDDVERSLVTDILAEYAADDLPNLSKLLMEADEKQFDMIFSKFKGWGENGLAVLTSVLEMKLPAELPCSDKRRDELAKRQANAGVALMRMGQGAKVWPLLKHSAEPRVRSYLIHRISPMGAGVAQIIQRFDVEPDISIRRALLLALGEYSEQALPPDARKTMLPKLQEIYRTEADPGLHGAAEWLLRTWRQETWLKSAISERAKDDKTQREIRLKMLSESLSQHKSPRAQWYVNGQGQTLVVLPGPVEFVMGSPSTQPDRGKDEIPHKRRIGRTFALASMAVTLDQYRRFNRDYSLPAIYSRSADVPVVNTSWYMAARYCNWLSAEEGIADDQWCYAIKGADDATDVELKANYLSLSGYRLPTEAEMEYATRAGAVTSRFFGQTDELLQKYAWYDKNGQERTWPVGSLKPNDFGLFDVHGNVWTWCQESYGRYPEGIAVHEDTEGDLVVKSTVDRTLRGGSFDALEWAVRSSARNFNPPSNRSALNGIRPARTLPPVPSTSLPTSPEAIPD